MSLRRIKKEYAEIQKLPSAFCCASPISEEDLYHWRGHIMGAVDTPFEGEYFSWISISLLIIHLNHSK